MNKAIRAAIVLTLGSLAIAAPSIWAYWVENGVALCTATGSQELPAIASDGAGGAIVVWNDVRSGTSDIYAQRVSASGENRWTADGIALCTAVFAQEIPSIVSDGTGGAIVVWHDYRSYTNYDIYAQRVNAAGVVQWASDGLPICTATGSQMYPVVVSDGAGGAIIAWQDSRSGNNDIYVQRVNASGAVQWASDGVVLCAATGGQYYPVIASDGAGGAIVAWYDYRNGSNYDIYAQRITASATVQWTVNGVALCTVAWNQERPCITSDGAGGAIVAWHDYRSGNYDIYAQRVNASGVVPWTATGVALCAAASTQMYPMIVSDGAGGAIATWQDYRNGTYDIYAQRISGTGSVQWTTDGVPLCTAGQHQQYPAIASDGTGGAIVTWQDYRSGAFHVYAQRADFSGNIQWTTDGVALCTAPGNRYNPVPVADGAGGAIIAWWDLRSGAEGDIYAQSVDALGRPGMLAPEIHAVSDIPGDQGGKIYLSWHAARADLFLTEDMSYYSIWRAIDPSQAALVLDSSASSLASLSAFDPMGDKSVVRVERVGVFTYFWELVATVEALHMEAYGKTLATLFDSTEVCNDYHYFQVVAHTSDPTVFWKSAPDSGYSVDNLAPALPLGLEAEQSYVPEGLALSWICNTETDLAAYRVYRGISTDFIPDDLSLIASLADTTFFDAGWTWSGGYYYKVSAVDIHGNESLFALLAPEQITGSETPLPPQPSFLAQNYPNPFNPTTRVEFGLTHAGHVSLRVYDTTGRIVRVIVDAHRPAGRYTEAWDGCNDSGRAVASGVYFYRLDAGTFSETKKMVLAR